MVSETMEPRVHNHDPEHGPGLACRESLKEGRARTRNTTRTPKGRKP